MEFLLGRPLFSVVYEYKKGVEIGLPICVLCHLAKSTPPMPNCFELSPRAIKVLSHYCQTFHGLFQRNKLAGSLLEETMYEALLMEAEPIDSIDWISGSHNPKADIYYTKMHFKLGLSIKSGTLVKGRPDLIQISGHRLGKAHEDLNLINRLLRDQTSDVLLCFLHRQRMQCYELIYIDASVFSYPVSATGWQATVGKKTGRVEEFCWQASDGFRATIKPKLSWQVWWTIPRKLCRQGPTVFYGHGPQQDIFSSQGILL